MKYLAALLSMFIAGMLVRSNLISGYSNSYASMTVFLMPGYELEKSRGRRQKVG
jgi:hypothetical protein